MHPTFGRYELLKRLAGGGMGEVYLARQRGLDGFQKLLVIKTLLPHLCEDEEFITMFKDEARLTAQLIHPNICQVFEFDQVEGTYFLAMEYLRGDDLRRLWKASEQKGTPLKVPLICRVIADAAAGLDFAHALRDDTGTPCGIVHRDISPQNILVTFEGGVKVIDFGVAKAAGRAQHTRTGALKGKYSYMSPEQVAGRNVDGRTDIFALGIVLHELLTGRRLFKADSDVQTLERVRQCTVPPPSKLNPQLPPSLDPVVLKALTKEPEDRYQTAQEMRLALEDWLIQGRNAASSAHLAEFLKLVYAERLDKEARLGPLLGDTGLVASPEQMKSPSYPSGPRAGSIQLSGRGAPMRTPLPGALLAQPQGATVNQRPGSNPGITPVHDSSGGVDLSTIRTESGWSPFPRQGPSSATIAIFAGLLIVALSALIMAGRKPAAPVAEKAAQAAFATLSVSSDPSGAALTVAGLPSGRTPQELTFLKPGPVRIELALDGYAPLATTLTLAPGPQQQVLRLERAAPAKFNVTLRTDPGGAEITEGDLVIGQTPFLWSTDRGPHQLTFTRAGYKEVSEKLDVQGSREVSVRLRRLEQKKQQVAPDLAIKGER